MLLLISLFTSCTYGFQPYVEASLLNKIIQKYQAFTEKRFFYLQSVLDSVEDKSTLEKLEEVNNFYNDVKYASDIEVYGVNDYWATPWEFLGKDKGDCEDYVISKYFALIYLKIDPKKLFFTYVSSSRFNGAHMVLTYFETPSSEPLVLDSNNHKIFPASQRTDLTPIYNFSGDSLYKASKNGVGLKIENQKVHKKWDNLKFNMQRKMI